MIEDQFRFDPVNEDDLFNVAALIEHTGQALKLARERELSHYGISSRNAATLLVVWALDNYATPTDISRWLLREPHSITELLARMERDGYIRRFQDRQRRNVVRVAMTEKGREAYFQSLRRESYHKIMSVLEDDEREELRRLLAKVWKAALTAAGTDIAWAKRASSHLSSSNHAGMPSSLQDGDATGSD